MGLFPLPYDRPRNLGFKVPDGGSSLGTDGSNLAAGGMHRCEAFARALGSEKNEGTRWKWRWTVCWRLGRGRRPRLGAGLRVLDVVCGRRAYRGGEEVGGS